MTNLGKCLLFYLKYPSEMERLYEAEEPKVEGLPNPDELLQKIRLVGDTAIREAAEFLEKCVPGIEEQFRPISAVRRKRNNLEKTWQLEFQISVKRSTDKHFWVGVTIHEERAALIPWVWCRGGRRVEDEMVRILGRGTKSTALQWGSGTVALAEIKIPVPERLEEAVPSDSLVTQVQQSFAFFTSQEVKAIAAIAGSRGEA